jgi:glycosyltransferase involved in cell wall biosynthesis
MTNKLISVIVPVYNVEKYLQRCIDSLLNQSYSPIEIILINDGSTDKSPSICDINQSEYSNIKVLHKENGGLSDARNKGIELSNGEYLTFVDSDDFLHRNYLKYLKLALDKFNTKISCCSYQEFPGNSGDFHLDIFDFGDVQFWNSNSCVENLLIRQSFTSAWAKLYHKSVFNKIEFPFGLLFEDMYIIPRMLIDSCGVSYVNKPLYYYNQEGYSITRSHFSLKKINDYYNAINLWHKLVNDEFPIYKARSEAKLIGDYLQIYNYSISNNRESNDSFHLKLKCNIIRLGWHTLFNNHTKFSDKIKLFMFYFGLLKFTLKYISRAKR